MQTACACADVINVRGIVDVYVDNCQILTGRGQLWANRRDRPQHSCIVPGGYGDVHAVKCSGLCVACVLPTG